VIEAVVPKKETTKDEWDTPTIPSLPADTLWLTVLEEVIEARNEKKAHLAAQWKLENSVRELEDQLAEVKRDLNSEGWGLWRAEERYDYAVEHLRNFEPY